MTMVKGKFRCLECDMTESECTCEKYCTCCQAQLGVRLCEGGLYYCQSCREAGDFKTE
jgi:hypothetical protein